MELYLSSINEGLAFTFFDLLTLLYADARFEVFVQVSLALQRTQLADSQIFIAPTVQTS